ncbi:NAD+ diphosphatase, partial [Phenoliferia sp. Uapishka_3]
MDAVANYYAGNLLNRLSYLRTSPAFLASALSSPKARFILFSKLSPLVLPAASDGSRSLHTVSWDDVKQEIGEDAAEVLRGSDGKDEAALGEVHSFYKVDTKALTSAEKRGLFISQPALVFLGVDERSAPLAAKSLPLSKPTDASTLETHSPFGIPYWALDVSSMEQLQKKVLLDGGGEFADLRAGMSTISPEQASLAAQGRALVDWNDRNKVRLPSAYSSFYLRCDDSSDLASKFCVACSRPLRSVWGGWKRVCAASQDSQDGLPPCLSKKGVHNYNYPRTDPVIIMAILSPDRESILLGRQRVWPKLFYSALAGFIESGETLEEAARREVFEEAGIVVGDVYYHSSQPWPYPSSLMLGVICVAKPDQTIRLDLDNELEDARYFSRQEVLAVLNGKAKAWSKEDVKSFEPVGEHQEPSNVHLDPDTLIGQIWFGASYAFPNFVIDWKPCADKHAKLTRRTTIAYTLINAWATNSYLSDTTE